MLGSRLHVQLHRDSFNTPWGFRLQGGKDVNEALTVRRVFSSSPAEGQLQRGDVILSINNRDALQLTHKEIQEVLKSGGGVIQLIINRPAPGTYTSPLSPPSATDRPRAPSLQLVDMYSELYEKFKVGLKDDSTPVAADYVRKKLQRLRQIASSGPSSASPSRPITIQMAEPSFYTSYNGPYQQPQHKPPHQPLHVYASPGPQYQHDFERQRSSYSQPPSTPTPTTPVPPWASQQFAPKRVSKLSKLGGGGFNFGTVFATLPRGTSAAQYASRQHIMSQSSYDGAEEPEPERLATGPIPKVCRLRNLGGGGYDFGSSFGAATLPRHGAGRRLSQPVKMPSSAGFGYQPSKSTINRYGGGGLDFGSDFSYKGYGQTPTQRVQTSIDFTPSPRATEASASFPQYNAYEQPHPPSQQVYTPTALLLEQQRLQEQREQDEAIAPVWERRRHFQQPQQTAVRAPQSKSAPKVVKPRPANTGYTNFGTDYSRPSGQQSSAPWRPANQLQQAPAPAPTSSVSAYTPITVHYTHQPAVSAGPKPSPPISSFANAQPSPQGWHRPDEEETRTPAWRNTLKATGVKPWESETGYAIEQQPVRSVPYNPFAAKSPIKLGPYMPNPTRVPIVDNKQQGPKVTHLQYNSPMHLYSKQSVNETLQGQTQAITKPSPSEANQSGDRDWSQSAVLRLISQEDTRKSKQPPAVAPKPQYSPVQSQQQHFYDDIGASDF